MGSSAFVESNYFKNCKYPMMSSMQGTDALGDGTFSGEDGGIIKAYNNIVIGESSLIYADENLNSFDAYLAKSRTELIPDTYKTKSGNFTYNNFDSMYDLGVLESNVDDPNEVEDIVTKYAGRMNGGDFKWKFNDDDAKNYNVDADLKMKILSYNSQLIRVLGEEIIEDTDEPEVNNPTIASSINHSFTEKGLESDVFTIIGNLSTSKGTVIYNNLELSKCLKIESSTSIKFNLSNKMTLVLVFGGNTDASGKKIKINGTKYEIVDNILEIELEPGDYEITKGDSVNLFYIVLHECKKH
jgi:LysM repeat protein